MGKTKSGNFTTFKDTSSKDLDYYTDLVIDVQEMKMAKNILKELNDAQTSDLDSTMWEK